MFFSKEAVLTLLSEKGIPFSKADHPAVHTIEEMDSLGLENAECIAKNLFLRDDKKRQYYLLCLRPHQRADLKRLRTVLASRPLSFASEEDLQALLGLSKGSVTPLGVLNDEARRVCVWFDVSFQGGQIGVHPNDNTATVWLETSALLRLIEGHGNPAGFADFSLL